MASPPEFIPLKSHATSSGCADYACNLCGALITERAPNMPGGGVSYHSPQRWRDDHTRWHERYELRVPEIPVALRNEVNHLTNRLNKLTRGLDEGMITIADLMGREDGEDPDVP